MAVATATTKIDPILTTGAEDLTLAKMAKIRPRLTLVQQRLCG